MKKNPKGSNACAFPFKSIFRLFFVLIFLAGVCLPRGYAGELIELVQGQGKITVSGTITNDKGEPIPGVTVVLKGTTQGSIADVNGKYSLVGVPADGVLLFSFVGMETKEMPVNGQMQINVTMSEGSIGLEEVVAIGYGTVKRRDITGSVASVSGDKIAAVPVANAAQALKGKLPGVNVISQDGRPDASISIRVRGGGSISQSNEPLFVVDGFPVSSISDIPGDQIESIDVLKDASSTAIYGARGANGVIIVTTKTAKEGKTTVSYNGYGQFNNPTKYLETMDAYNYIAYNWAYAKAISNTYSAGWEKLWAIGGQPKADGSANSAGIDHYKNINAKNYSEEMYGNSFSQSHNLSVSGGNESTKMNFSLNQDDDTGMKINSYYKRTSVALKVDNKIRSNVLLSFDTRFTHVDKVGHEGTTNGRGSILSSSYFFRPIATADVLGILDDSQNTALGMYDQILQDRYNPVARTMDYLPNNLNNSLRANTALNWEVFKGLSFRSELGISTYWNKNKTWSGAVYNDYYDNAGNMTYSGNASISKSEGWGMRWANTLSYDVQGLGDNHRLNVLVGQEMSNSGSESLSISGERYPVTFDMERAFAMMGQFKSDEIKTTVNSSTTPPTATAAVTEYNSFSASVGTPGRMLSYFGRLNYSLMDKYLFTATFRADGSSRFAPSNRWGYFPAAAIAWRISEESFIQDVEAIDNLKLRLSYGTVGNDGISSDLWKMKWKAGDLVDYSLNEARQPTYVPNSSTMANQKLKWETTITRNLGLDYAFFDSRIYGTIDAYWNSTVDLLMLTSIPAITGFSFTYDNIGSTSNKGIEFALGADIVRSKDFNLSASFNINFNKGNVEELSDGVTGLYKTNWGSTMTQPNTGDYQLIEGMPVGLVRGYTVDENDQYYKTSDFNYDAATGTYTLKDGVADIASGILGTVYGTTGTHKPGSQTAYPGVLKMKDIAGPDETGPDGVVDQNDVSIIGDMNPKHTGGFNIDARYKGLDCQLGFNWSYGNKIYNANYLAAFYGSKEDGLFKNRLSYLEGAYRIFDIQNNQITRVTDPAALDALNANATTFLPYHENPICNTLGIQDGSFLRLNTVTLGYSLPVNFIKKIGMSKIRIYGTIYNALTLTQYKGLDPEVNTNMSQGGAEYPTMGLDWGAYPRARSFTFGVNVEF